MENIKISVIEVEKPEGVNLILGQSHFIKTVEDVYEAIATSVPGAEFGIAFCESSGDRLVRVDGTNREMMDIASRNAAKIGAGHSFIIFLKNTYPINVLNRIKEVPEVCGIFAATANPLQVIVAETGKGRGILGVIDGLAPLGIEDEKKVAERKNFLRKIGYKR